MVKTLVILILLFNGEIVKEKLYFAKSVTVLECLEFADQHVNN